MLKSWLLRNFKSVKDSGEISLSPLTVIAGSNSSGKSTLLQSILLVAQTLTSSVSERTFLLNGPMVRLGTFTDIRTFRTKKNISIGWTLEPLAERAAQFAFGVPVSQINCLLEIAPNLGEKTDELGDLNPSLQKCRLEVTQSGDQRKATLEIIRRSGSVKEHLHHLGLDLENLSLPPYVRNPQARFEYDISLDPASFSEVSGEEHGLTLVGCWMQHFLPNGFLVRFDQRRLIVDLLTDFSPSFVNSLSHSNLRRTVMITPGVDPRIWETLRTTLPVELHEAFGIPSADSNRRTAVTIYEWRQRIQSLLIQNADVSGYLKASRLAIEGILEQVTPRYQVTFTSLPSALESAVNLLTNNSREAFDQKVRYLGPLRDEPRPLQPLGLGGSDPQSVGFRGERSAAVYNLYHDQVIAYIPSKRLDSLSHPIGANVKLETALVDWLDYMGLATSLASKDLGKLGHELKIKTEGTRSAHDLTHVGVGVSQIFPVLLMCLLAAPDDLLIFEQPELHLHPAVQAKLGDFFLSIAALGKQCIIETHSEHIVNRIRLRVVLAPGDSLTNLSNIYFVERRAGISDFRKVKVTEFGSVPEWPVGFFDQSQIEAQSIISAAIAKRNESAESK